MNREIKFRAWSEKTKEWISDPTDSSMLSRYLKGYRNTVDEGNDYKTIITQQYIGSKDKNGNEIYEGDLLLFEGSPLLPEELRVVEFIYVVDFYDGSFKIPYMYRRMKGSDVVEVAGRSKLNNFDRLEIIGNINENPLNVL
jgi:uncharacterized phage protein (TIGR01671 family)